jgi:hypothetical protein
VPDDNESLAKGSGAAANQAAGKAMTPVVPAATAVADEDVEHYEEVAEYRIGEGPPPLALVVMFFLIVIWATLSWVPFFGY